MQQLDDDVRWRVLARGDSAPQSDDQAVIADYFNLGTSLSQLADLWAARDVRFSTIREYIPGGEESHIQLNMAPVLYNVAAL